MRLSLLLASLLAAGLAGGAVAIGLQAAVDAGEGTTTTVTVVERGQVRAPAAPTVSQPGSRGAFDAAAIYAARAGGVVTLYAARAGGVVTLYASFPGGASQGSGFVVDPAGTILTNAHVITDVADDPRTVSGATELFVEFRDGERVRGRIVGWDLFSDVGVVRVDPAAHSLAPVPLGRSSAVRVGEPVAAIGSPFGNQSSLSVGVVSATGRQIDSLTSAYAVADAIQIDAPINSGNSGGPLFDAQGAVIGINAQIRSRSGTAEGVGFAIPIDLARRVLREVERTGRVAYAYIGI
ncbi:MAG: trypsin-like serine protease, partial [Actinobacteria bacterium]|nr:trypsin-like serine protease [Actinomycetota bacterium]